MLTRKQHELLRFIQTRLEESGISPSFEEMKEALDLKSKSGVHRLISALEERGFIRRLPNRARALEVLRQPEDSTTKQARPAPANSNEAPAPLAVTAAKRHPAWPDVPTMSTYYPDFVVAGWLGLSAPAGTPPDIVAKMNAATQAAVNDPATAAKLRALGLTPEAMDVTRFDTFVKEDTARWKEWIKISGIQPQ